MIRYSTELNLSWELVGHCCNVWEIEHWFGIRGVENEQDSWLSIQKYLNILRQSHIYRFANFVEYVARWSSYELKTKEKRALISLKRSLTLNKVESFYGEGKASVKQFSISIIWMEKWWVIFNGYRYSFFLERSWTKCKN